MTNAMAHQIGPDPDTTTLPTRALLACGAVAGPAFIIAFLVQGAFRPDYHPLRHSISSLAVGSPYGWIQSVNFIVGGLLTLAFAAGVRRALRPGPGDRLAAILIALWGIGLLGAGIFTTGPEAGYPPGTPVRVTETSIHAILHNWSAGLGFPALFVACLVFTRRFAARRERGWALYCAASAAVFITFTVLHNYTTGRETGFGVGFSGLFQRIAVICGWCWLTALALRLTPPTGRSSGSGPGPARRRATGPIDAGRSPAW
jgi:hypothetical protein